MPLEKLEVASSSNGVEIGVRISARWNAVFADFLLVLKVNLTTTISFTSFAVECAATVTKRVKRLPTAVVKLTLIE